jgi:hypothetical protein
VNAYNPEVDPRCTFCRIRNPDTATRDSLRYFFYECHTTGVIVDQFVNKYFPIIEEDRVKREFYWYGINVGHADHQSINLLIFDTLRFVLYRCKKRKHLPNFVQVDREVVFLLKTTAAFNKKFKEQLQSDEFAILTAALG